MKSKMKYLVTTLSMLVAFILIVTTDVNAKTVTVTDEASLRSALEEGYTEESTIKLGDDITVSEHIAVYLNDKPLTFDLSGKN